MDPPDKDMKEQHSNMTLERERLEVHLRTISKEISEMKISQRREN